MDSLSNDQVTRLCAVIDGEVDAFLARDWSGMRFAYLFPDATYVRCRVNGRARSEAFITAIGVGDDGRRHFVGFTCANAESYASWRGFLQDLEGRGVRNVRLITSDAHDGLVRAMSEVYPEATWQRCIVHVKRDALAKVEGNTRTVAVFSELYLSHLGFSVGNDPFGHHSRYYRAALVRAMYRNADAGIMPQDKFLAWFYDNAPNDAGHELDMEDLACSQPFDEPGLLRNADPAEALAKKD